jgi:Tol biopolymer transport system component
MVGKTFAHYRILEKAGSGGMGVVYRATDETLRRDVALKVLTPSASAPGTGREALLREARASSALNHPNICTVYEVGEFEEQAYIAMEFVEGEALNRRIPPDGLPTETVLEYGIQISSALEHAHSRGILHRDLKTANVRTTAAGQTKILDFGLAVHIQEASLSGATRTVNSDFDGGKIAGTLLYMAPETLKGDMSDARSDIWSLGVMLYEMAAGTLPFHGRTQFELTTAILHESPAPLSPRVSPGLRAIILRCLAKQREQRYQRAGEIRAALEALQSQADTGSVPVVQRGSSRRLILVSAAGVVALLLLGGFLVLRFRGQSEAPGLPTAADGRLRLLLSSEGELDGPSLSPDGKMFAYVEDIGERSQLYVSRISGGDRVQLTTDNSRKANAEFSPDGEHIAFSRLKPETQSSEICIVPSLGGQATPVVEGGRYPAWSSDGSRLAFIGSRPGKPEALFTSARDGTDRRVLLEADAQFPFFGQPTWSPDGGSIVVTRSRGGNNREIWLVPIQGGAGRSLTVDRPGVFSDSPVFSPDGRGVIFRSSRGGASNLWWQSIKGGSPVRLTSGPGPDLSPSVSKAGAIAFRNSRSRGVLILLEFATGKTTTLLSNSATLWAPAFSPDGREIAYARTAPDGAWHIWIIPVSGGPPSQLTQGTLPEVYPRYSPRGDAIFFNTWGTDPLGMWRAPRNGSPPTQIRLGGNASDAYADVSRDGRWLAFVRAEGGVPRVYIAAADGSGAPRRLTDSSSAMPRWSPNDDWIAFTQDRGFDSGVWLIHPDGSGAQRLTEIGGWPVWWPDGKQIGFQAIGPDGNEQIRVYALETKQVRTLRGINFVGSNFPFDISPDGKWLVSTNSVHDTEEFWLLEPSGK